MASSVVASPPRSLVRRPSARARSTADSTASGLGFQSESVAQHHRGREEHRQRVGGAGARDVGRRAVHGLEQAGTVGRRARRSGSIPIEPVSIAASSLRMSPNMFSVTITSKCRGAGDELHRGVVDQHVLELDVRELARMHARARPRATAGEVSSTFALSTLVTRERAAPKATRAIRSISATRVDADVGGRVRGARLLAEVDPAGELAHDEQVGALDHSRA